MVYELARLKRGLTAFVLVSVLSAIVGMPFCASLAGGSDDSPNNLPVLRLDREKVAVNLDGIPTLESHHATPSIIWSRGLEEMRVVDSPSLQVSFQLETIVYDNPLDQRNPRMAFDNNAGVLWAAFTHHDVTDDIYLAKSDDFGLTWTTFALADNQGYNESKPAIAMFDNTIMIFYEQDNIGEEQHTRFIRSQDGGQIWNSYYLSWDWTNDPGFDSLKDFRNMDVTIVRSRWFHWTADCYNETNNTRTAAFMWTETDGDSWTFVYWRVSLHIGEDFLHPVIMENTADGYIHNVWQIWNSTTGDYDVVWMIVDHNLSSLTGWWTANIDGGNSEIAPDISIRDDYVFVVWQNGTDLTGFYSDDGGKIAPYLLFITGNTSWNETYPSCTIDISFSLHVAFSNNSVIYYGGSSNPLSQPFDFYVVSENSSAADHHRLLDLILVFDDPAIAWTDIRNTNADIYFSAALSNRPPIAVAKPVFQEVYVDNTAWLYGNESYDPDGIIVNYSWRIDGPLGVIQLYGVIVSFVPTEEGGYLVTLTVRDNGGLEDSALAYVNAIISPANLPPVANAGEDQIVFMWEVVTFDGSGSYDPDGIIVSYYWDFDDGSNATGEIVTHIYNETGIFHVVLAVVDDDFALDTDRAVVVVLDPHPDPPKGKGTRQSGQDIILEWELSSDDGDDFDDVVNYAIYYSTIYNPEGNGYVFLAEVPAGTNYYVHVGAGEGNWNTYFYYIQANDSDGYTKWEDQLVKFVRYLEAGMHILSVPAILEKYETETVLQSINGSYDYLRCYESSEEGWKTYWAFKNYGELLEINISRGYWIQMTRDDHLLVLGIVPKMVEIELNPGWNFVSYPSFINRSLSDALSSIAYLKVDRYSNVGPYYIGRMTLTETMTAGEGYWIYVDAPQVWTVEN